MTISCSRRPWQFDIPDNWMAIHQHVLHKQHIHGCVHSRPGYLCVEVQSVDNVRTRICMRVRAMIFVLAAYIWSLGVMELTNNLTFQTPAVGPVAATVRELLWKVVTGNNRDRCCPTPIRLVLHAGLQLTPHVAWCFFAWAPPSIVIIQVASRALLVRHSVFVQPVHAGGITPHEEILRRPGGAIIPEVRLRPIRHAPSEADVTLAVLNVATRTASFLASIQCRPVGVQCTLGVPVSTAISGSNQSLVHGADSAILCHPRRSEMTVRLSCKLKWRCVREDLHSSPRCRSGRPRSKPGMKDTCKANHGGHARHQQASTNCADAVAGHRTIA
mmetsp:Transcript_32142/g.92424  ORF Transcript_32142/g.92424 Transcript_32142/m.92424 type:complete len:330 (-) Transcript_32142:84-1073(-)